MGDYKLQVAARGLIVKDEKLLLVSNDSKFWYTPGGRLESNETLSECVEREVYEEVGIDIKSDKLIFVFDFFDRKDKLHKVEVYFTVKESNFDLPKNWSDKGGPVRFFKFFSLEELKNNNFVAPEFLKDGKWIEDVSINLYKGAAVK